MIKIAYIEPADHFLLPVSGRSYTVVNHFLLSRLEGIRQVLSGNPEIMLTWINNSILVDQFFKSGEYTGYDGVLVTAPDDRSREIIKKLQRQVPIVISEDTDPGGKFNFIGPDHAADVSRIIAAIKQENSSRVALIACHDIPVTRVLIDLFERSLIKEKLSFDHNDIIGMQPKTGYLMMGRIAEEEKWKVIVEEVLKRPEADVFILLDPAPIAEVYDNLLQSHNKRIPEDIKLISMKDIGHFPQTRMDIMSIMTHIKQDYRSIGRLSMECLLDMISGKRSGSGNNILVPGIFCRGSTISSALLRDRKSDEYFKSTVMEYIDHNYKREISARTISKSMDLSYSYFLKKFKTCFGFNLIDAVSRVRLDKASYLLAHSSASITEILNEVGYGNVNTFNRQFKKRFGKTPSEYRRFS